MENAIFNIVFGVALLTLLFHAFRGLPGAGSRASNLAGCASVALSGGWAIGAFNPISVLGAALMAIGMMVALAFAIVRIGRFGAAVIQSLR